MKISITRMSKLPLDITGYQSSYQNKYDEVMTEHNNKWNEIYRSKGKVNRKERDELITNQAKEYQELQETIEKELLDKYPMIKEIDLPTTPQEFKDVCSEYDALSLVLVPDLKEDRVYGFLNDHQKENKVDLSKKDTNG